MNNRKLTGGALKRRNALAVALAVGLGFTGVAMGQATTGTIFGIAPGGAGETVSVTGNGVSRTATVGQDGRYTVSALPVGTYTVTLSKNGQTVSTRSNVNITVGAGTEVDFAKATTLGAVQVTANALPTIDVSTVTTSTVITAKNLEQLPVGRSAESIALLTPGTVQGSAYFGNAVSIGGSSVAENAYYVNGYNTGEPYRNIGGFQLPYGSIAQQETLAGGFSAKYGRSDGGVISQVGKSGTNEWHYGGQVVWEPRFLQSDPKNLYYKVQPLPAGPGTWYHDSGYAPGSLYRYRKHNKQWRTIYSAYVSGPLIKDKLFFFAAAELTKAQSTNVGTVTNGTVSYSGSHTTKFYGKINWNIDQNNIFEGTFLQSDSANGSGATYYFDSATGQSQNFKAVNNKNIDNARFLIGKYTSYISDKATLSVLWGKGNFANPTVYGNKSDLPYIMGGNNQNPAYWPSGTNPNTGIVNSQTNRAVYASDAALSTQGLRVDFNYQLGNHNLGVGIDNMRYTAHNQGIGSNGPPAPPQVSTNFGTGVLQHGFWRYRYFGGNAYYAEWYNISFRTSMSVRQDAYYFQDEWQVTPNLLLNLGVRNDNYTNYNNVGVAFVNEKNQWEPRLGFSWDVFGDSSFKVYGNAGRYYLALPANAAERAANSSTYVYQYFTYTGIDSNGIPTGLTPASFTPQLKTPDGETGLPKDPLQVTASNLKPQYIDQYNIGFDKKLNDQWTYGAKLGYRHLGTVIDDECSAYKVGQKMTQMGLNPADYSTGLYGAAYCRLINPGMTNTLLVAKNDGSGYTKVQMSQKDWGYLRKPTRNITSLNLYLEHPFDGTWYGRIDYTWTHAYGNTAGQVRPDFGQADVSKTEDWDSWQLMQGQYGQLLNSREHQIRIRGAYQITPEWLVSTTALIQSGTPQECLGYFGPNATGDPTGYNGGGSGNYHWCAGQIVRPGSNSKYAGHTPWTEIVNLGIRYTPAYADHRLAFKMDVFNVLNQQKATQTFPSLVAANHVVSNTFHMPVSLTPPRYIRLSVSYDY